MYLLLIVNSRVIHLYIFFTPFRASLREGIRVLLDPLDLEDYQDLLDGKEVEPKPMKSKSKSCITCNNPNMHYVAT